MDIETRRANERHVIVAAISGVLEAGCTVTVSDWDSVIILSESSNHDEAVEAFIRSGEPSFTVKRTIEGVVLEGWVDFLGQDKPGLEVTASPHLQLEEALKAANAVISQLGL